MTKEGKKYALKVLLIVFIAIISLMSFQTSAFAKENDMPKGYVYISVEKATIGQGFLIIPEKVPYYEGDTVAMVLTRTLEEKGYEYSNTGNPNASSFYLQSIIDSKGSLKANFPDYINNSDEGTSLSKTRKEASLGEFDYGSMTGWVFKYNDLHSQVGAGSVPCEDNMVIRWAFTVVGYGSDCWDTGWGTSIVPVQANRDNLIKTIADFNSCDDKEELLKYSEVKDSYDILIKYGGDYTIEQEEIDVAVQNMNLSVKNARNEIQAQKDADEVKKLIESIAEVKYTEECHNLIISARNAYNSLSEIAKAKIDEKTYNILISAEKRYEELKKENLSKDNDLSEKEQSIKENNISTPKTNDIVDIELFLLCFIISTGSIIYFILNERFNNKTKKRN